MTFDEAVWAVMMGAVIVWLMMVVCTEPDDGHPPW